MKKWIEIAREGTFTDSAGREQTFTEADLAAIASSYDAQKRDCPLVFGHPKNDAAPAFGWVESLKSSGGKLLASFARVPESVRKLVNDGHYRHVSMSLMPDRKTLRHIALLGAAQPAIDGLKAVELADGNEDDKDAITVEFSTSTGEANMPDDELQRKIGQLEEQIKALKTENASLKQQAADHKTGKDKAETEKAEAQAKAEKAAADFAAYKGQIEKERREARVSAMVKAGKITPAEKAGVLEFATVLSRQEGTVDFAAPDGTKENISLEERYLREQEARKPNDLMRDFSAPPLHVTDDAQNFNPADLTAKL